MNHIYIPPFKDVQVYDAIDTEIPICSNHSNKTFNNEDTEYENVDENATVSKVVKTANHLNLKLFTLFHFRTCKIMIHVVI